jgi:hypothetical protein
MRTGVPKTLYFIAMLMASCRDAANTKPFAAKQEPAKQEARALEEKGAFVSVEPEKEHAQIERRIGYLRSKMSSRTSLKQMFKNALRTDTRVIGIGESHHIAIDYGQLL